MLQPKPRMKSSTCQGDQRIKQPKDQRNFLQYCWRALWNLLKTHHQESQNQSSPATCRFRRNIRILVESFRWRSRHNCRHRAPHKRKDKKGRDRLCWDEGKLMLLGEHRHQQKLPALESLVHRWATLHEHLSWVPSRPWRRQFDNTDHPRIRWGCIDCPLRKPHWGRKKGYSIRIECVAWIT